MKQNICIFPFHINSVKIQKLKINEEENKAIIRGSLCIRKEIEERLRWTLNGVSFEPSKIEYWHPIVQEKDFIQEGIKLVKKGIE